MRFSLFSLLGLCSLIFLVSCEQDQIVETVELPTPEARFVDLSQYNGGKVLGKDGQPTIEIHSAEYITAGDGDEMGNVIFFNNRGNKQLGLDFDPDFQLDGTTAVTYYVDQNRPSSTSPLATTTAEINDAMDTWDAVTCSDLDITEIPFDGRPTGLVALILGYGGSAFYVADVVHAGWLPAGFFDRLAPPNGSQNILGVTFTLTTTGPDGNPVLVSREIYYNDNFVWDGANGVDTESIALHEAGHGLSQAHFGKGFYNPSSDKVQFSPRAVMNAAYTGVNTRIDGTDKGGHCSIWANWPNN